MNWKVPLADLDYGGEEEEAVLGVLRSKWLTMGGVTQQFEAEFARLTGAKHCLAVTNATVALHLACLAGGVGPGDEVIAPALTFVASANCAAYTGVTVRFADVIGPEELNIDPSEIERLVTPRTKAVIVVHYGGYPVRMREVLEVARRYGLKVIEDAAHAPGAYLEGKHLGTWGDVGCFSFFSNKNLSTGEGGMLVTNDDEIAEKVRLLRSHGMTSLTWDRHQGHAHSYDVVELGYNYRIDEIRSALGLAQLHKLAEGNERRRQITETYWEAFADTGLGLPFAKLSALSHQLSAKECAVVSAHHLFPILLPEGVEREGFMDRLKAEGIQTSIHYPPIHKFTYYQERCRGVALPRTEEVAAREVTLPLYPTMREEQVGMVIEAVKSALG